MRIIYRELKGHRVKKGTIKTKGNNRKNIFASGLTCLYNLYYDSENKIWKNYDDFEYDKYYDSNVHNINSLKAAIRHLKKHKHYLPKGCIFKLCSIVEEYSIFIIL